MTLRTMTYGSSAGCMVGRSSVRLIASLHRLFSWRLRARRARLTRAILPLGCLGSMPAARKTRGLSGEEVGGSRKRNERRKTDRASRLSVSCGDRCSVWSRSSVLVDDQLPKFPRHRQYGHTFLELFHYSDKHPHVGMHAAASAHAHFSRKPIVVESVAAHRSDELQCAGRYHLFRGAPEHWT